MLFEDDKHWMHFDKNKDDLLLSVERDKKKKKMMILTLEGSI